jgi:filamentous hemagglutinin family protein
MALALLAAPTVGRTQTVVTPDAGNPFALGTTAVQSGSTITIDGGTRAGGNLFHSFNQFSVGVGVTARWTASDALSVANVVNRVTGGEASRIDGTLDSTALPNAAFWFVNPAGIVFGPGAQVSVPAAAHFSTAAELRFADGGHFAVTAPDGSTLSVAPPQAWGFLGGEGSIAISGVGPDFQGVGPEFAAPETSLSFAAANIAVEDSEILSRGLDLTAVGGGPAEVGISNPLATTGTGGIQIFNSLLGAVDSSVGARSVRVNGGFLDIQTSGLFSTGDLFVQASDRIEAIATGFQVASFTDQAPGTIVIRAPSVGMDSSRLIAGAIEDGAAGSILVDTGDLFLFESEVTNDAADGVGAAPGAIILRSTGDLVLLNSAVRSNATGAADGGVIVIEGRDLEITSSRVESDTFGLATGAAGLVTVTAETLHMSATGRITSTTSSEGAGGNVIVSVRDVLQMESDAAIRSDALDAGDAGSVTILAGAIDMFDGASITSRAETGTGDAGTVLIQAEQLLMSDATISSGSDSFGAGGNVFITAEEILLDGNRRAFTAISAETLGFGDAGQIFIQTDSMVLRDGGRVTSDTRGSGRAGDIAIFAKDLLLERGGQIASDSFDLGSAGNVTISADELVVDGGDFEATFISSDALGDGDAGTVSVISKSILVDNGGFISSDTYVSGRGGDLVISADTIDLRNFGQIRSQTRLLGDAGTVNIEAKTVTLASGGAILSEAIGLSSEGNAGSVELVTETITVGDESSISTSTAGAGDAGGVFIEAKALTVDGGRITSSAEIGSTGSASVLFLAAEEFSVLNGGAIATLSTNPNVAGLVAIEAGDLRVDGPGSIVSSENQSGNPSFGGQIGPGGDAGTILIAADNMTVSNGGRISTNAFAGAAGDIAIAIERPGLLVLEGAKAPGVIQTSSGPGTGGRIEISDPLAIISNGGSILALGELQGANVVIQSRYFVNSADRVNTVAVDGQIDLQTGLYDVSSGVVSRDLSVLDASRVLRGQCPAVRSTGSVSQLITRPVGPYVREAAPEGLDIPVLRRAPAPGACR